MFSHADEQRREYLSREAWYALWLSLVKDGTVTDEMRDQILSHPSVPNWLVRFLH